MPFRASKRSARRRRFGTCGEQLRVDAHGARIFAPRADPFERTIVWMTRPVRVYESPRCACAYSASCGPYASLASLASLALPRRRCRRRVKPRVWCPEESFVGARSPYGPQSALIFVPLARRGWRLMGSSSRGVPLM
jgi:hypothetical protein